MSKWIELAVPLELQSDYFFENKKITLNLSSLEKEEDFAANNYFYYEIIYYRQLIGLRPWEAADEFLPRLLTAWEESQPLLANYFAKRLTEKTAVPMKEGIALCIQMMFWMNRVPVQLTDQLASIEELMVSPVNARERLNFIIERPTHYHSFRQLTELMSELKKQYYAKKASE